MKINHGTFKIFHWHSDVEQIKQNIFESWEDKKVEKSFPWFSALPTRLYVHSTARWIYVPLLHWWCTFFLVFQFSMVFEAASIHTLWAISPIFRSWSVCLRVVSFQLLSKGRE